mgnify:CR=1 FL=1
MTDPQACEILKTWKKTLRAHGYRVTGPRKLVMEIITSSPVALTPQKIYQRSLKTADPPGMASIYRTVEMLDELELIQQVHQPGGCHGIWPALKGHKHYVICRECGQVQVVPGSEEMGSYVQRVEEETGYRVEEHWLQFFGLCQGCR